MSTQSQEQEYIERLNQLANNAAGYIKPVRSDDPNFPIAQVPVPMQQEPGAMPGGVDQNTSPAFPPEPQAPEQGMQGIETPTTTYNLQGA